jgi:signal transduction histidine kinase
MAPLRRYINERIAERERIARELHDTYLQGFHALVLRLHSIANRVPSGDRLRNDIDDLLDYGDAILDEGRTRVLELRRLPADIDFAQSLANAARELTCGGATRFRLTVEGKERALHACVGEQVLRIFEEAVRNVLKHANAKAIYAVLTYGSRTFRLSLRDDGTGFPWLSLADRRAAGHFGLLGMSERAALIGGRLQITTREGFGTEVTISMPAHAAYQEHRPRP